MARQYPKPRSRRRPALLRERLAGLESEPLWGLHVAVNRAEPPGYPYSDSDARAEERSFPRSGSISPRASAPTRWDRRT